MVDPAGALPNNPVPGGLAAGVVEPAGGFPNIEPAGFWSVILAPNRPPVAGADEVGADGPALDV